MVTIAALFSLLDKSRRKADLLMIEVCYNVDRKWKRRAEGGCAIGYGVVRIVGRIQKCIVDPR